MALYTINQLKTMNLPEDIAILVNNFDCCQELLEEIECRFFEEGEDVDLFSHSYLNEDDRKNEDIMANVSAINDVFKYISFVVEATNGDLAGYWHGPENIDINTSPIIIYDTEGQFNLLNGANLTEALVGNYLFDDDDEFLEFKEHFKKCGINIASKWSELPEPCPETKPSELHVKLYKDYLG